MDYPTIPSHPILCHTKNKRLHHSLVVCHTNRNRLQPSEMWMLFLLLHAIYRFPCKCLCIGWWISWRWINKHCQPLWCYTLDVRRMAKTWNLLCDPFPKSNVSDFHWLTAFCCLIHKHKFRYISNKLRNIKYENKNWFCQLQQSACVSRSVKYETSNVSSDYSAIQCWNEVKLEMAAYLS